MMSESDFSDIENSVEKQKDLALKKAASGLRSFLMKYKVDPAQKVDPKLYTHASIPDVTIKSRFKVENMGGTYVIPSTDSVVYAEFLKKYGEFISLGGTPALVERSLADGYEPFRIDIDLRVANQFLGKVHSYHCEGAENGTLDLYTNVTRMIDDVVSCVYEHFQATVHIPKTTVHHEFFVSERVDKTLSEAKDINGNVLYKDGFHVISPDLKLTAQQQRFIRDVICTNVSAAKQVSKCKYKGFWHINAANSHPEGIWGVYDEAVINGGNWTLTGSAKPGKSSYTNVVVVTYVAKNKKVIESVGAFKKSIVAYDEWLTDFVDSRHEGASQATIAAIVTDHLSIRKPLHPEGYLVDIKRESTTSEESALQVFNRFIEKHQKIKADAVKRTTTPFSSSGTFTKMSFDQLRDILLYHLSTSRADDRKTWWIVGNILTDYAIADEDNAEAYKELYHDFSKRSNKYEERAVDRMWDQCRSLALNPTEGVTRSTVGTLRFWLKEDDPECLLPKLRPTEFDRVANTGTLCKSIAEKFPGFRTQEENIYTIDAVLIAFSCFSEDVFRDADAVDAIHREFYTHLGLPFQQMWVTLVQFYNMAIEVSRWQRADVGSANTSSKYDQKGFDTLAFLAATSCYCDPSYRSEWADLVEQILDYYLLQPHIRNGFPTGALFDMASRRDTDARRALSQFVRTLSRGYLAAPYTKSGTILAYGDGIMPAEEGVHKIWVECTPGAHTDQYTRRLRTYIMRALERSERKASNIFMQRRERTEYNNMITGVGLQNFDSMLDDAPSRSVSGPETQSAYDTLTDGQLEAVGEKLARCLKSAHSIHCKAHVKLLAESRDMIKRGERQGYINRLVAAARDHNQMGCEQCAPKLKSVAGSVAGAPTYRAKKAGRGSINADEAFEINETLYGDVGRREEVIETFAYGAPFGSLEDIKHVYKAVRYMLENACDYRFSARDVAEQADTCARVATTVAGVPAAELPERLDTKEGLHCFKNCVLDGIAHPGRLLLRGATQTDLISITTGVPLVHPRTLTSKTIAMFDEMMRQIVPDDETWNYLLIQLGNSMMGRKPIDESIIVAYGATAANGKSTLYKIIAEAFGSFATTININVLFDAPIKNDPNGASSEIAKMKGKKLIVTHEVTSENTLNSQTAKQLSGGDTVSYRQLYDIGRTAEMKGGHHIICNSLFKLKDYNDEGIKRRLVFLEFPSKFVDKVPADAKPEDLLFPIRNLSSDDVKKMAVCLNYAVIRAYTSWLNSGDSYLKRPERSVQIANMFYAKGNPASDVIAENFVVASSHTELYSRIYAQCHLPKKQTLDAIAASLGVDIEVSTETGTFVSEIREAMKKALYGGIMPRNLPLKSFDENIERVLGQGVVDPVTGRHFYPGLLSGSRTDLPADVHYMHQIMTPTSKSIICSKSTTHRLLLKGVSKLADCNILVTESMNRALALKENVTNIIPSVKSGRKVYVDSNVDTAEYVPHPRERDEPVVDDFHQSSDNEEEVYESLLTEFDTGHEFATKNVPSTSDGARDLTTAAQRAAVVIGATKPFTLEKRVSKKSATATSPTIAPMPSPSLQASAFTLGEAHVSPVKKQRVSPALEAVVSPRLSPALEAAVSPLVKSVSPRVSPAPEAAVSVRSTDADVVSPVKEAKPRRARLTDRSDIKALAMNVPK